MRLGAPKIQKASALPASIKQTFILGQVLHPMAPDDLIKRWIISQTLLVEPRIDVRRFRRAVGKVMQRHDSLRTRFVEHGDTWRVLIDPPGQDLVREVDLGDVSDEVFRATLAEMVDAPMEVIDAPLAEFVIVKCGKRGDALVTRLHHTITDGYGILIFVEDLLKALIGLPFFGAAVSFGDYLARYAAPLPSVAEKVDAYWKELHKDFPASLNVGRRAKGLPPVRNGIGDIDQHRMKFRTTDKSARHLQDLAASAKLGVNTLLSAGFLESLCRVHDFDRLMFMTHMARTNPALDTYMGDHTFDPVLPYTTAPGGDMAQAAKDLNAVQVEAMAYLPSDCARYGSAYFEGLYDAGCFLDQFIIYNPRAKAREKRSLFSSGLTANPGEKQSLGPFSVTNLDIEGTTLILSEIELFLGDTANGTNLVLGYDRHAFSDNEVQKIGETCLDLLSLDLREIARA